MRIKEEDYFDDLKWAGFLGAIVGAIGGSLFSGKSSKEEEIIKSYNSQQQEIFHRRQLLNPVSNIDKLQKDPNAYQIYSEAISMFLQGFNRASAIFAAGLFEYLLQQKYGSMKFVALINKAEKDNLLSKSDMHLLHAIREERNSFIHDFSKEVNIDDAEFLLNLSGKVIERIFH